LRSLLVDPAPDLTREGFRELFLDVRDQADRTRDDRKAAAHLPWEVELAQDGADGAGRVDRQVAAVSRARLLGDQLHELDVAPGQAVVGGDREQPGGAGIGRLVDGMPESRDGLFRFLRAGHDLAREVARFGIGCGGPKRLLERSRRFFDRATETRSHSEQARCHRALQRLGRAEVGEARRDGARGEAVLHKRDGDRVEHC